MVRTLAKALAAPALLWAVGCSSQSAKGPSEGATPPAAQAGNTGESAGGSVTAATPASNASPAAVSTPSNSSSSGSSTSSAAKNLSPQDQIARGVKLSEQGKRREAIAAYTAVLKQEPNNLTALLYRAGEEYALQDFQAAERDVAQALKLDPNYAEGYILRAHLCGVKHEYQHAVDDFFTALKYPEREANFATYFGDKKDVVAHVYLAAAYSECPDVTFRDDAKAFQHALQACQLDKWQNRRYVSLLVNAIAGAKSQQDAVARQQQAVAAAPTESIKQVLQAAVEAFDMRSEFPLR